MKTAVVATVLLASFAARAADYSAFETHGFKSRQGSIPYRLLKPNQIEAGKKYPLVLVLHGFGERGTDNEKQLKDFAPLFLKSALRDKFPCFVVVPQAPGSWIEHAVFDKPIPLSPKPPSALALAVELVESTTKKDPVDPDRVYLLGYSNGACAVWDLLERLPKAWAAAVPMAGAGDPSHIAAAKSVPIWAFHGSKDPTIPIERMHEMESALRGGRPSVVHRRQRRSSLRRQSQGPGRSEPLAVDVRPTPGSARRLLRGSGRQEGEASHKSSKRSQIAPRLRSRSNGPICAVRREWGAKRLRRGDRC